MKIVLPADQPSMQPPQSKDYADRVITPQATLATRHGSPLAKRSWMKLLGHSEPHPRA
jgi:hypothetical protein